jgi:hypothetical protein
MTSASATSRDRHRRSRGRAGAWWCGLVAATAIAALPGPAQAEVALVWNAPAGCPSGAAVEERIRTIAGGSLGASAPLRAEGRITRHGTRYRLTLIVRDGAVRRERIIDSNSCADLAGAAAVALGLLLRDAPKAETTRPSPDATTSGEARGQRTTTTTTTATTDGESRASPGSSAPSAERSRNSRPSSEQQTPLSEQQTLTPTDEVPESAEEPSPSVEATELRFVLRAPLLALDVGPLPAAVASLGAGVGIRYGSWHLTAVARVFQDETLWSTLIPEVGAQVEHMEAELWNCRAWSSGRFDVAPCLVLGLNRLTAAGTGPGVSARTQYSTSLTVGAAAAAHLHLFDWVALFATVGAGLETSRPRFVIDGLGEAGRWGPARLSAGVGSEWIF